jgi:arylsulfatase A-like enzyme
VRVRLQRDCRLRIRKLFRARPTPRDGGISLSPFAKEKLWASIKVLLAVVVSLAAWGASKATNAGEPSKQPLNVLFIAVDDLRPELRSYGADHMETPRLDQLAAEGRQFNFHYVQVPTCGASRCAMLTGRYPTEPSRYDNGAFSALPREDSPTPVSMPDMFRRAGYKTASIGKISHEPDGKREDGENETPHSWDETSMPVGKWQDAWSAFFAYADGSTRIPNRTPAAERGEVSDDGYPDGLIANAAIEKLRELKGEPFFLAVGFIKPHLPFNAPAKYWDMYNEAKIPLAPYRSPPSDTDPKVSLHKSGELTPRYTGFAKKGVVSEEEALRLRHAYFACVSYVDAQVGCVLDELDRLGLRDSTIVIVWGDHGWHLGDHGIWGKHTLHEVALRSPLLVRLPDMLMPGTPTDGLVESVDIYPTVAELCGLNLPTGLDGKSFARLLADPAADGKSAAYGFWARGRAHSIRTPRYRLTLWTKHGQPAEVAQIELYDHRSDPNETENIATDHPVLVQELLGKLRRGAPLLRERAQAAP